jgi:hypothetical protein
MGLAAAMQYQASRSEMVGGRLQVTAKGKAEAALSVKVRALRATFRGHCRAVLKGRTPLSAVGP